MRRSITAVIVAVLLLPAAASAQLPNDFLPRVSVTPWVAYRVGYTQVFEQMTVRGDTTRFTRSELEPDGGLAAGFDADVRVIGPWSVIGGVGYTPGVDAVLVTTSDAGEQFFTAHVNEMTFAKLGVALRLRESEPDFRLHRPTASIFLAPAVVRVKPSEDPDISASLNESYNQWALNFGFKGETSLWSRHVMFHIAAEDYFTFWSEDVPERRANAQRPTDDGVLTRTELDFDPSHLLLLRVGLSFQF